MKFKGLSEKAADLILRMVDAKKIHPCQPHKRLDYWKKKIQTIDAKNI